MESSNEKLYREIGEQIKRLRNNKGLSQMDVASRAGIDKSAYQRIERGGTNPTIKTLNQVLGVMDISIPDFFCTMKKKME